VTSGLPGGPQISSTSSSRPPLA